MIRPPPRSTLFPYTPLSRFCAATPAMSTVSWTVTRKPAASRCSTHFLQQPQVEVLRSEEHTSELQSQSNLVCRLLLEKKKKKRTVGRLTTVACASLSHLYIN